MNIDNHFNGADTYLKTAIFKVERHDYTGARASLAQANIHIRELYDHVGKLEVMKADVELSAERD